MAFALNPAHDSCPCESGRIIIDCCFVAPDKLFKKSCMRTHKEVSSSFKNPKCYASSLLGCSKEISREHFISDGILRILNREHGLKVSGFHWQNNSDDEVKISPNALAGNILCGRHNNMLSPLDQCAVSFFGKLNDLGNLLKMKDSRKAFLFNGHDIERWMLKVLSGSLASGNISYKSKKLAKSMPLNSWLQILFGNQNFPKGWGIYFIGGAGDWVNAKAGIGFAPITDGKILFGAIVEVHGFRFVLIMSDPPTHRIRSLLANGSYRPKELAFSNDYRSSQATFIFSWEVKGDNKTVHLRYSESPPPWFSS